MEMPESDPLPTERWHEKLSTVCPCADERHRLIAFIFFCFSFFAASQRYEFLRFKLIPCFTIHNTHTGSDALCERASGGGICWEINDTKNGSSMSLVLSEVQQPAIVLKFSSNRLSRSLVTR